MNLKNRIGLLSGLAATVIAACASDLQPRLTKPAKLLLDESFSSPTINKPWEPGGRRGAFTIVEGALQGVCAPDDNHGPSIGVPLEGRNITVGFRFKYVKRGYFLFLLDGESQFGGAAHLLRVALSPTQTTIAQDRGTPASKLAQKKQKDAAAENGKAAPVPTKEELADPAFYRTEKLASQPAKSADAEWHNVLIEQNGNDVLVQVDNLPPLTAAGTVLDVKKSRIVLLIGQAGTVQVDDVKVWENTRQ
jgi:hypothetical protein